MHETPVKYLYIPVNLRHSRLAIVMPWSGTFTNATRSLPADSPYLLSSHWTAELNCPINSRFGFNDVHTGIFKLTPANAQRFTGAFRDHVESDDRKLLVRLRTLGPLLVK
jgi:hypothetical protein